MYLGGVGGLYLFSVYSGGGGPYVYALCALCMHEEGRCTNTPPTKGKYRHIYIYIYIEREREKERTRERKT